MLFDTRFEPFDDYEPESPPSSFHRNQIPVRRVKSARNYTHRRRERYSLRVPKTVYTTRDYTYPRSLESIDDWSLYRLNPPSSPLPGPSSSLNVSSISPGGSTTTTPGSMCGEPRGARRVQSFRCTSKGGVVKMGDFFLGNASPDNYVAKEEVPSHYHHYHHGGGGNGGSSGITSSSHHLSGQESFSSSASHHHGGSGSHYHHQPLHVSLSASSATQGGISSRETSDGRSGGSMGGGMMGGSVIGGERGIGSNCGNNNNNGYLPRGSPTCSRKSSNSCDSLRSSKTFHVFVAGFKSVGKHRVMSACLGNSVNERLKATILIDYEQFNINFNLIDKFDDSEELGEDSFPPSSVQGKRNQALLIIYSIADRKSFEKAGQLLTLAILRQAHSQPKLSICLIANKSDLVRARVVTTEEGSDLADRFNVNFIEVSAEIGDNIEQIMVWIVEKIKENLSVINNGSSSKSSLKTGTVKVKNKVITRARTCIRQIFKRFIFKTRSAENLNSIN